MFRSSGPMAMIVNSSELCAAGFDLDLDLETG
jgi:hypothetical protein